MISKRFDLLLKSYMRHCSFTRKELSKLLQIKDLDLYLKHPFKIPTPLFVLKVINILQIPEELVWRSYFNSIYYHFYQEGNVILVDYKKYKNMVDENYKKHKKLNSKAYPSEEVWRKDNLNGFDFYFYAENIMKKKYKKLPKINQLDDIYMYDSTKKNVLIKSYINSILIEYNLPYYICFDDNEEFLLEERY